MTALHLAAKCGHTEVVALLVKEGKVDVNVKDAVCCISFVVLTTNFNLATQLSM
jgi:ankyrin repeat protein